MVHTENLEAHSTVASVLTGDQVLVIERYEVGLAISGFGIVEDILNLAKASETRPVLALRY